MSSLLASIPQLGSVVLLLTFIFFVFGIIAVQLFGGVLHSRCRITPYPVTKRAKTCLALPCPSLPCSFLPRPALRAPVWPGVDARLGIARTANPLLPGRLTPPHLTLPVPGESELVQRLQGRSGHLS